jgi:drug/metabolite transporter (DMT)-like permease
MITIMGRWPKIKLAINDKVGMKAVTIGSIFGPFLGVSLALFAIQHTNTGVASTLMALVPIFIIWPSAIMFREKIKIQQIIGAIISIIGVSLFFL